jgi:prepilin peptidase CpaA
MDALIHLTLLALLLAATVTDLRTRRIPNLLTVPAMVLGLALHAANGGWDGLLLALGGLGLGLGLMLVPFLFGVMGAGDVKLMAAAGAFLGAGAVLKAFVFTSLAGGVYALAVLALRPALLARALGALRDSLRLFLATRQFAYAPVATGRLPKLAYGAAIAAGTVASVLHSGGVAAFIPHWWA